MQALPQDREIFEAPIPAPKGFDPGLAIAASPETAAPLRNPPHGGAQIPRRGRRIPAAGVGGIPGRPLGGTQNGGTGGLRLLASEVGPPQQAPGDAAIPRQRPVPAVKRFAREVLAGASTLQDVKVDRR